MNAANARTPSLEERLTAASEGLLFISEGEAPFRFVHLPGEGEGAPIANEVRARLRPPPGTEIEEEPLASFLAGHTDKADPHDDVAQANVGRFRALESVLRRELAGVRVFRVGETEVRCYLLGRTPNGSLAGLATTAYET